MPEYEIMVVAEVYTTYEIEADSQEEAIEQAREMFSPHDLYTDTADISHILVESAPGSSNFVYPPS